MSRRSHVGVVGLVSHVRVVSVLCLMSCVSVVFYVHLMRHVCS